MYRVRVSLGAMRRVSSRPAQHPAHWRFMSTQTLTKIRALRLAKLKEVYAPLEKLQEGSEEHETLAHSGKIWESYFQPQETKRYDELQQQHQGILAQIDGWKEVMKLRIPELGKALVSEYAHQSVGLENNPIRAGESFHIFDLMDKEILAPINFASLSASELLDVSLPRYHSSTDRSATTELMNHILASHWIATTATSQPGTPGLDEMDMRKLAALSIRGTDAEEAYTRGWGGEVALGGYRKSPVGVASDLLRIFPSPREVTACMKRFFEWRDMRHYDKQVHPLIHACHLTAYFVHIHPFPDGNGRVSRMLMHDYMLRQGYLPVVMQNLTRKDYLAMMSACLDGEPSEFVSIVLETQLEELQTLYSRQRME